jgi:hypothetical protein
MTAVIGPGQRDNGDFIATAAQMLDQLPIIKVATGDGVECAVDEESDFQYSVVSIQ